MSVAIHYTPIKPPTGQEREVFGLQVAIADWLKAWFRYGSTEKFQFLIGDAAEWDEVQKIAATAGVDAKRLVALDRRFPEQNFPQLTTIFRPEPDTRKLLWQRQQNGNFSFCGLAHAISGTEAGDVLQDYCLAPSRSDRRDCLPFARGAIRYSRLLVKLWRLSAGALRGALSMPGAIAGDTARYRHRKIHEPRTPEKRAAQRKKLGVGENDIVLLWVGRLSAAIKAHPLAMLRAAEWRRKKPVPKYIWLWSAILCRRKPKRNSKNLPAMLHQGQCHFYRPPTTSVFPTVVGCGRYFSVAYRQYAGKFWPDAD